MSKILEQYKKLKMMRKESIRANAPLLPEEPKEEFVLKSHKSLKKYKAKDNKYCNNNCSKKRKKRI